MANATSFNAVSVTQYDRRGRRRRGQYGQPEQRDQHQRCHPARPDAASAT